MAESLGSREVTETVTDNGGEEPRFSLGFIGAGRAGSALAAAAHLAGYPVTAVHSRSTPSAQRLAHHVGAHVAMTVAAAAQAADIVFVTVPDSAIASVAGSVAAAGVRLEGHAMVHCSASLDPGVLDAVRVTGCAVGTLHPLQALIGVESASTLAGSGFAVAGDTAVRSRLELLVADLGGVLLQVDGVDRRLYHAAAVLAGVAPLALLADAADLLGAAGVDRDAAEQALGALLAGAVVNARRVGARSALTGPVVRGDAAVVAGHLDALADNPTIAELYRILTAETLRLAGAEGRQEIADLVTDTQATPPGRPQPFRVA